MNIETFFTLIGAVLLVFFAVLLYTRIAGLRTFAKMTSFDFATTIAIGTIIGTSVMNPEQKLWNGLIAIALIIALQYLVVYLMRKSSVLEKILSNKPLLLMKNGEILHKNLAKANIQESDLLAKLREANVLQFHQVKAVVLETTGDVSVLHTTEETAVDAKLLSKVAEE